MLFEKETWLKIACLGHAICGIATAAVTIILRKNKKDKNWRTQRSPKTL
jgi:hypothetical protein